MTLSRRGFLKLLGLSSVALAVEPVRVAAAEWFPADDDAEVALTPEQVRGLTAALHEIYTSRITDLVYSENKFLRLVKGRA